MTGSAGTLRAYRCTGCGLIELVSREFCAACGHHALKVVFVPGTGVCRARTVVRVAADANCYVAVVLVELDAGATVMGRADEGLAVGDRAVLSSATGHGETFFEPGS